MSETEREMSITIASLRAQFGGLKAYLEDVEEENRVLRAELCTFKLKGVDKPGHGN